MAYDALNKMHKDKMPYLSNAPLTFTGIFILFSIQKSLVMFYQFAEKHSDLCNLEGIAIFQNMTNKLKP